jgi:hypothetical protein
MCKCHYKMVTRNSFENANMNQRGQNLTESNIICLRVNGDGFEFDGCSSKVSSGVVSRLDQLRYWMVDVLDFL